jgi:predicted hydrolase (HD superfamily)
VIAIWKNLKIKIGKIMKTKRGNVIVEYIGRKNSISALEKMLKKNSLSKNLCDVQEIVQKLKNDNDEMEKRMFAIKAVDLDKKQ